MVNFNNFTNNFTVEALPVGHPFAALPALDDGFAEFQPAPQVCQAASAAMARTQAAVAPVFINAASAGQSSVKRGEESPSLSTKLRATDSSDSDGNSKIESATHKGTPTNSPSLTSTSAPTPSTNPPPANVKKAKPEAIVTQLSNEALVKRVLEKFPLPVITLTIPGKGFLSCSTSTNELTVGLGTIVSDTAKILRNFLSKNNSCLHKRKDKDIKRKKEILLNIVDEVYRQIKIKVPDLELPPNAAINEKIDLELADGKEIAPSDVRRAHNRASTIGANFDPRSLNLSE